MNLTTAKKANVKLAVAINREMTNYETMEKYEAFDGSVRDVELNIATVADAKKIIEICGYTNWVIYRDDKGSGWSNDYVQVEASESVIAWDKADAEKKAKADKERAELIRDINASLKSKVVYDKEISGKRFSITVKRADITDDSKRYRIEPNIEYVIKHGTEKFDTWDFRKYESKSGAILKKNYISYYGGNAWDSLKERARKTKDATEFAEYLGGIIRAIKENDGNAILNNRGLK